MHSSLQLFDARAVAYTLVMRHQFVGDHFDLALNRESLVRDEVTSDRGEVRC